MSLRERINKPEYFYRPQQGLRRIVQTFLPQPSTVQVVLPWGLRMRVNPDEDLGNALWRFGIYDLPLSETIWRLLDRGETAIDVGANIGYVTGLLAARSGPGARVVAFEPHPQLFSELLSHISDWSDQRISLIKPYDVALSCQGGTAFLDEGKNFESNRGTSRITQDPSNIEIRTARLDEFGSDFGPIGLLKLDVEGHEEEAFSGAEKLLRAKAIRDIVFEDHSRSFKSPVPSMLAGLGYAIFAVTRSLTGPLLVKAGARYTSASYLPPNFLATADPQRAIARVKARGWQVLRLISLD
jgi:FkbM family methyltransferase